MDRWGGVLTPAPAYATASSWVRESAPLGLPPLPPLLSPSLLSLPCVRWCAHAVNAWRVDNPAADARAAIRRNKIAHDLAALQRLQPGVPVRLKHRSDALKTDNWARQLAEADDFQLREDLNEGLLLHGVRLAAPSGMRDPTVRAPSARLRTR